jgi:hypothetical protein
MITFVCRKVSLKSLGLSVGNDLTVGYQATQVRTTTYPYIFIIKYDTVLHLPSMNVGFLGFFI